MKKTKKTKPYIVILLIFAIIAVAVFAVSLFPKTGIFEKTITMNNISGNMECVSSIEERIVRGNSLTGLIEPNETVKILFDYYDCNEVKREDIVAYNYAGNTEPIIKIIKGVSGDKFDFQEFEGGWHILINEEILKNSEDQPYFLNERSHRMLSLYYEDYGGLIPENTYLILGNLASGATDSTRFGLVHKDDFFGVITTFR